MFDPAGDMDKRKKYFRAVTVAVLLVGLSGYGKISDRTFRVQMARMIASEGMLRLVEAQYGQKAAEPVAKTISDRSETEDRPRAALTFDDGPHVTYTPMLLDGLRQRGIHATFFLMGKNIEGKEDIVKQMQKDGHLIGNHTYDHVQLDKLPGDQACQQISAIINPIIFSPELPSFWSPNPKNFFVIFLASYIKITPVRTNKIPNILTTILIIFFNILYFLHLYINMFCPKCQGF